MFSTVLLLFSFFLVIINVSLSLVHLYTVYCIYIHQWAAPETQTGPWHDTPHLLFLTGPQHVSTSATSPEGGGDAGVDELCCHLLALSDEHGLQGLQRLALSYVSRPGGAGGRGSTFSSPWLERAGAGWGGGGGAEGPVPGILGLGWPCRV